MDKRLRNTLRNVVTQCRKRLEEAVGKLLQGQFGVHADGKVEDAARLPHLSAEDLRYREEVLAHLEHIKASGLTPKDSAAQLIREAAFTHLNRLCAYKMMTSRGLIEDPLGKGLNSRGFIFYLAEHPDKEALYKGGQKEAAYRHYFDWLNDGLSSEIDVLFAREDLATRLFPPYRILAEVIDLINSTELQDIWKEDETIGWVFQYFTPKELRDKARKESAAPRNSYEMSFRNQFFTPRYVVEFLVDNTLGRAWYEMREGETALAESCRYLAKEKKAEDRDSETSSRRPKKDPREIKVLDPACGSGHFLLYCFDLFQTIYEEAYTDAALGSKLQQDFPDAEDFKRQIPGLILAHNIHGIDIDLRVTQLAALALWLRAQRAFQQMGLKENRPRIERMSLVCAEPMPGEEDLLEEFIAELSPHPLGGLIGELVRNVFARMKLAGEAGALVRIEDDIREPIEQARRQWREVVRQQVERKEELAKKGALFDYKIEEQQQKLIFDIADLTDETVWHDAESQVLTALREYARRASNGRGLLRRLFSDDAEQGFAFIDICRKKFDVVLMNPPFGDASIPSKPYIDEIYGDTKGDVYKAFVECFQDRLVPGGFLGIISSRTGFFLSGSSDWRERIVLRLYRPLVLADFGMGVLDAMVETAAYVLRSLTSEEDRQLTLQFAEELQEVPTDKNDLFSTKKYEVTRNLKRHQANGELRRLYNAGFIKPVEGHFPRWLRVDDEIAKAPALANAPYPSLVCLRVLGEEEKERGLYEALHHDSPQRFVVEPQDFRKLPNMPFCYWVSNNIRQLFIDLPPFESQNRSARVGPYSGDDFRRLRLVYEVSADMVGRHRRWVPFAKGGSYSPFYADIHLLVAWDESRHTFLDFWGRPGRMIERPESVDCFFRTGLTWSLRSDKLSFRLLPAGCIFGHKGPAVFSAQDCKNELLTMVALMNSKSFDFLLQTLVARVSLAQAFEVGLIQKVPFPSISEPEIEQLRKQSHKLIERKIALDTANETSHVLHLPALLQVNGDNLTQRAAAWRVRVSDAERQLALGEQEIDDMAFRLYGMTDEDRRAVESSVAQNAPTADDEKQDEAEDETESDRPTTERRSLTTDLISYFVGCAFGRWDVRYATGERPALELPDPFAPLPVCAPGALTGEDGLPLKEAPNDYPLPIDPDGILVDDLTHADDVLTRVREVFELIWPNTAEALEREMCELLDVRELRDYLRKPAAGGFWMDHVKRYSKSRRKAPIYWLLQSSKKSYALWLYYHRLDKDILYKALLNYVEPKIRLEASNLDQIGHQREAVGTAGREAKQVEKQLEKQESLLSELHDFNDKLKRAAELHLEPDLNDGVVLNIAPLWELVPWTEAKKYWNELLDGKYEWSTVSKQLRAKGLIKT